MVASEDRVVVTLKADGSAPWIVVHADSADEAHTLLAGVYSGEQNLAQHAAAASAVLTNEWAEEKKRQGGGHEAAVGRVAQAVGGQVVQQAAPPAQQQAFGNVPTCVHGEMVQRAGTSAKGPWSGWFCPTPKGTPGQCSPQFDKKK